MKKLSASDKKRVIKDWASVLPSMSPLKSMQLVKRNGPVVSGLYLDPTSSGFTVHYYVHALLTAFPIVTVGCDVALRDAHGMEENVSLKRHTEQFADIVDGFRQQCPQAFEDALSCSTLDRQMAFYIDNNPFNYPFQDMLNHALLFAWCGRDDDARRQAEAHAATIAAWPADIKEQMGDEQAFLAQFEQARHPDHLRQVVESELLAHQLDGLPDHGLDCV
jgi:hypothetical protein